jgi:hypothetical protein
VAAPGDELRLRGAAGTPASARELGRLPFELDRYVALEPRLVSAHWTEEPPGPRVGACAKVVADIPFTIAFVRRLVGTQEATMTITTWDPPHRAAVAVETRHFVGRAEIEVSDRDQGSEVRVNGIARARSRRVNLALRPIAPLLERLATRSIERGIQRAAAVALAAG